MTETPDVKRPRDEKRNLKEAARKEAYANLLERTERALEVMYDGSYYYIVGVDGMLYHAEHNGEPEKTSTQWFELLLTGDRVDLVGRDQCYEFEEIL